jgi:iron complex outermembrane recepter protein
VISPAPMGAPANLVRTGADGNPYVCTITLTNPAYGCIPAPVLNTQTVAGQYPGDWYNWIRADLDETNLFEETSFSFQVDGPLFTLPAGAVQAVFGAEYRTSSIDDTPEVNNINNNVYGFSSAQITRGEDNVSEVFAEVEVPLLRGAPLAHALTVNASGRFTDYESYGSDSTYKLSVNWEPIEYLVFRATQGTSFRAPALFEQFLGATTGFLSSANDPCDQYGTLDPSDQVYINCDAQIGNPAFQQLNGITVFSGGGAATELFAETSENSTIGFTWRPLRDPDGLGDLSLAADRFSIELNDSVTRLGGQNILQLCYGSPNPATEPTCNLVTRDASNRLTVNDNYTNISNQSAQGWDVGVRYLHTLLGGDATATFNLTNYTLQEFQLVPVIDPADTNGRIGSPETLVDLVLDYERGPWTLRYGVTWVAEMSDYAALEEDPSTSPFILATSDYYLHDTSVQYRADAGWQLTMGVRNLFDQSPPRVSSVDPLINGLGSVPIYSGFDYTGRQFFVNMSTRF